MQYETFQYAKLVEAVNNLEYDEEKVKYISNEMLRCRSVIVDISNDIKKMEVEPIAITTKDAEINKLISEALKNDTQFNHEVAKEILGIVEDKICSSYHTYIQKADDLKRHYESCIELQVKLYHIRQNDKTGIIKKTNDGRIIWKFGEDKLLRTFKALKDNELLPEYKRDEILIHFVNERMNRFTFTEMQMTPFNWLNSDNSFAVFVNELSARGAIPQQNKFKVWTEHFINQNGKKFKSLSQKRNYADSTTNTGDIIRQILDSIEI